MTKRNKIIYWIATIWLALGMLSSGIVQLFNVKSETDFIINMGYSYLLSNNTGGLENFGSCNSTYP